MMRMTTKKRREMTRKWRTEATKKTTAKKEEEEDDDEEEEEEDVGAAHFEYGSDLEEDTMDGEYCKLFFLGSVEWNSWLCLLTWERREKLRFALVLVVVSFVHAVTIVMLMLTASNFQSLTFGIFFLLNHIHQSLRPLKSRPNLRRRKKTTAPVKVRLGFWSTLKNCFCLNIVKDFSFPYLGKLSAHYAEGVFTNV